MMQQRQIVVRLSNFGSRVLRNCGVAVSQEGYEDGASTCACGREREGIVWWKGARKREGAGEGGGEAPVRAGRGRRGKGQSLSSKHEGDERGSNTLANVLPKFAVAWIGLLAASADLSLRHIVAVLQFKPIPVCDCVCVCARVRVYAAQFPSSSRMWDSSASTLTHVCAHTNQRSMQAHGPTTAPTRASADTDTNAGMKTLEE
jgi:hypothetical protein